MSMKNLNKVYLIGELGLVTPPPDDTVDGVISLVIDGHTWAVAVDRINAAFLAGKSGGALALEGALLPGHGDTVVKLQRVLWISPVRSSKVA